MQIEVIIWQDGKALFRQLIHAQTNFEVEFPAENAPQDASYVLRKLQVITTGHVIPTPPVLTPPQA